MAKTADDVRPELVEFTTLLKAHYDLYALVLFGSHAQGTASASSDIDVAVFSDDFGKDILGEMKNLFKLRRLIDTDIEPLPFSKSDFFEHGPADFVRQILTTGKVIFREGRFYE